MANPQTQTCACQGYPVEISDANRAAHNMSAPHRYSVLKEINAPQEILERLMTEHHGNAWRSLINIQTCAAQPAEGCPCRSQKPYVSGECPDCRCRSAKALA